jgi:hypothetical protein
MVKGYGFATVDGRRVQVHRQALAERLGRPIAPGMVAMHTCDNPPCCNPAHLREGTISENTIDARDKGRTAKLTAADVVAIRTERAGQSSRSIAELAAAYGVGHGTIHDVIYGRSWRDIVAAVGQ